jgi:esterase/lipase superfamily enzyme
MFIITNRRVVPGARGLDQLGSTVNEKGPNELRVARVTGRAGAWDLEILDDELDEARKREIGMDPSQPAYASQYAAFKTFERVRKQKKHLVLFVHGFNNDIEAVVSRCMSLERTYGVVTAAFSWPANGGGARGVVDYLSDKSDARISAGALDRTLDKMHAYLRDYSRRLADLVRARAHKKHAADHEKRDEAITTECENACPFTINLMLHSMGNYLFKGVMESSAYRANRHLLFDNVLMVAADTNNHDHAEWVDRIPCRNRLYVTINEDDAALFASRAKIGEEQRERLGHSVNGLNSRQAVYVNFTDARHVRGSHAYFEGDALKNPTVKRFFALALNGDRAEDRLGLAYESPRNCHRIK